MELFGCGGIVQGSVASFQITWHQLFWEEVKLGVSENSGIPKSSILIGFFHYKTIHFGVPLFLETPNWLREGRLKCSMIRSDFGFSASWGKDFLSLFAWNPHEFYFWRAFPPQNKAGNSNQNSRVIKGFQVVFLISWSRKRPTCNFGTFRPTENHGSVENGTNFPWCVSYRPLESVNFPLYHGESSWGESLVGWTSNVPLNCRRNKLQPPKSWVFERYDVSHPSVSYPLFMFSGVICSDVYIALETNSQWFRPLKSGRYYP